MAEARAPDYAKKGAFPLPPQRRDLTGEVTLLSSLTYDESIITHLQANDAPEFTKGAARNAARVTKGRILQTH